MSRPVVTETLTAARDVGSAAVSSAEPTDTTAAAPGLRLLCPVCSAPMTYADLQRHASPADIVLFGERAAHLASTASAGLDAQEGSGALRMAKKKRSGRRCGGGIQEWVGGAGLAAWLAARLRAAHECWRRRQRQKREERTSEAFVRATARQCPGCQWWTESAGGCKHMRCKSGFLHS
jgi:hypothetical protein